MPPQQSGSPASARAAATSEEGWRRMSASVGAAEGPEPRRIPRDRGGQPGRWFARRKLSCVLGPRHFRAAPTRQHCKIGRGRDSMAVRHLCQRVQSLIDGPRWQSCTWYGEVSLVARGGRERSGVGVVHARALRYRISGLYGLVRSARRWYDARSRGCQGALVGQSSDVPASFRPFCGRAGPDTARSFRLRPDRGLDAREGGICDT
jgi:hypothetical protein